MKNFTRFFMLACGLVVLSVTMATAGVIDTLSAFNPKSTHRWYRIAALQTQAARFEPRAAGQLREIQLLLSGKSASGTGRVRLLGYEAGASAPFLMADLVEPIIIRKSRPGPERMVIRLREPVHINQRQFFVAVDRLSDGVVLVTDSDVKPVCCEDQSESFRYQYLQTNDGRWWTGKYGFAIDVVMSYDRDPELQWLADVTQELGFADTARVKGGIAWGDYNGDTRLDVLFNGHLYENLGASFIDITEQVGLKGIPQAGFFLDVNNDSRLDILFLGNSDSLNPGGSTLFIGREGGVFEPRSLSLPPILNPTSFSIADADLDGYLDIFIGQGRDGEGRALQNFLLINDRAGGFIDRAEKLYGSLASHISQGSQWVDVDGDGYLDLYVVNQGKNAAELWRSNGDGTFSIVLGSEDRAPDQILSVNTLGGHWQDADGDGRSDLLAPQHATLKYLKGELGDIHSIVRGVELDAVLPSSSDDTQGIEFAEKRGSGVWVDVDNSGTLDLYFSSASPCRNAHLYTSSLSGVYESRSSEFGLLHLPAGPDGIWIDYDNDGRLDLATLVNGYFHLYRNTIDKSGNYVSIEVADVEMTGLKIDVYSGDTKITREVTSGRGLLMQDPLRLHFGIGDAASIDSVQVRWPGGGIQTFTDIRPNTLNRLRRNESSTSSDALLTGVRAFPNPFTDNLTLGFELKGRVRVSILIYDLQGNLVGQPHDGVLDPGMQNITWRAVGVDGTLMPQGTYIYRIIAAGEVINGRVVLGR